MESMKRKQSVLYGPFETATVKDIAVYDVDAFFAPQLIVGQKRGISIAQPMQHRSSTTVVFEVL